MNDKLRAFPTAVVGIAALILIVSLIHASRERKTDPSAVLDQQSMPAYESAKLEGLDYLDQLKNRQTLWADLKSFLATNKIKTTKSQPVTLMLFADGDCQLCISELMDLLTRFETTLRVKVIMIGTTREQRNLTPYAAVSGGRFNNLLIADTSGFICTRLGSPPMPTILVFDENRVLIDGLIAVMKDFKSREDFFYSVAKRLRRTL